MIFVSHVTAPANTPSDSPVKVELPVVKGTITLVSIQFPPGVNALAHLTVSIGLLQLFPSNQNTDFSTGGETIAWDEQITVDTDPATLVIRAWNEDTVYDHTLTVRVVIQPTTAGLSTSAALAELQQQQTAQAGSS